METSHEDRFYGNVIELSQFIKRLIERLYSKKLTKIEPGLIDIATTIVTCGPKDQQVEKFINSSYLLWENIRKRDEGFIKTNALDIFSGIPTDYIETFAGIFDIEENGSKVITEKDISTIFEFFSSFVRISIKYIHDKRIPYLRPDGVCGYKVRFMQHINLKDLSEAWGVKLFFPVRK